jgi:diguanylate cyclase (GGDEF)-like protein
MANTPRTPHNNIAVLVVCAVALGFLVATTVALLIPALNPALVPLTVLLVGLATTGAVALMLRVYLGSRLRRLYRTLRRVEGGNYVIRCETGDDEIGALGDQLNRLLQKLTDLSVNVIDTDRELQWTQKELRLKEQLTEKGRLLEATNLQLENRLKELSLLFSTSRTLSSSIELDMMLNNFCQAGAKVLEVDRFCIMVHDEASHSLIVKATTGFEDVAGRGVDGMRFFPGEGISGTVFEKKAMMYIRDLDNEPRFLHFRGKLRIAGSALVLPLMSGERPVGVMMLNRRKRDGFSFEDIGLFHIIANQLAVGIGNALLYQKTRELATHDELTGLYNRRMLDTRLDMEWERADRFNTVLSVIMIDVDHFKRFNDEHGHLLGDQVLRHTARLIQGQLRKVDTVARFGGEEFALLLPRTDKKEAANVAEKLRLLVRGSPLAASSEQTLGITISAGVASTTDQPESAHKLVEMADHALLVSKTSGRDRVSAYGAISGMALPSTDAVN